MKVVLLERVDKLGGIGDVVDVKPGYARNFLLPQVQGAARDARPIMDRFEREREAIEKLSTPSAPRSRP